MLTKNKIFKVRRLNISRISRQYSTSSGKSPFESNNKQIATPNKTTITNNVPTSSYIKNPYEWVDPEDPSRVYDYSNSDEPLPPHIQDQILRYKEQQKRRFAYRPNNDKVTTSQVPTKYKLVFRTQPQQSVVTKPVNNVSMMSGEASPAIKVPEPAASKSVIVDNLKKSEAIELFPKTKKLVISVDLCDNVELSQKDICQVKINYPPEEKDLSLYQHKQNIRNNLKYLPREKFLVVGLYIISKGNIPNTMANDKRELKNFVQEIRKEFPKCIIWYDEVTLCRGD